MSKPISNSFGHKAMKEVGCTNERKKKLTLDNAHCLRCSRQSLFVPALNSVPRIYADSYVVKFDVPYYLRYPKH